MLIHAGTQERSFLPLNFERIFLGKEYGVFARNKHQNTHWISLLQDLITCNETFLYSRITVQKKKSNVNHPHACIDLMRKFIFTFGNLRVGNSVCQLISGLLGVLCPVVAM